MASFLSRFLGTFLGRWLGPQGEAAALVLDVDATAPTPEAQARVRVGEEVSSGRVGTGLFFEVDPVRVSIQAGPSVPSADLVLRAPEPASVPTWALDPSGFELLQPKGLAIQAAPPLPVAEVSPAGVRQASIIYYIPLPTMGMQAAVPRGAQVSAGPRLPEAEVSAHHFDVIDDDELSAILAAIVAEDLAA